MPWVDPSAVVSDRTTLRQSLLDIACGVTASHFAADAFKQQDGLVGQFGVDTASWPRVMNVDCISRMPAPAGAAGCSASPVHRC